jgi:murein DD-endopeptidase MepM/ murein hydrolase activator NlpD
MQQTLSDQVTPVRLASHLSVLLVAAAVLLFSRVEIPEWDFQLVAMPTAQPQAAGFNSVTTRMAELLSNPAGAAPIESELQPQIVPFTIIPERTRQVVQIYTVAAGDTVLGIAQRFGLNPETLQWSNPDLEANPDMLRIGDQVKILPLDGVLHTVRAGDTLSALASRYKVGAEQIVAYDSNNLADAAAPLIIGSDLVIPGGTKPFIQQQIVGINTSSVSVPDDAATGSGNFSWPASGSISQGYWGGHRALDIASRTGAPVKAADGGFVTLAGGGWNGGYGNHVIIDHGNGFATLYAHLNTIFVKSGENVGAGQQIGTVGNTGNSTGPHLHFEILYQGVPRNPGNYLR